MAKTPEKTAVEIDVRPSPEAREALTLRTQATALVVTNRETHAEALEFIRGAKKLKRAIEDHWSRITRSVDDLKKNLLTLKRSDLDPVEQAISVAERTALDYETAERRRAQEEQDRVRREEEARAQKERDAELKRMEREALKAEEGSKDLSERERKFCDLVATNVTPYEAAKLAGYKSPDDQSVRLLATPKIVAAIASIRKATVLREQAAAKKETPLDVQTREVKPELGKAAGVSTRTTYSAEVVDVVAFWSAVFSGQIPIEAVLPNQVYLNQQAVALKGSFEQAYPGCKLHTKTGIAG